ncbi:MAG: hypothetical protein K0U38_09910 [Epsilonproteobacteria bacterium]|nr:hypothetical protein [Campylobacterota bacterium]
MKSILYLSSILIFIGCSAPKSIEPTASCLQYQKELNELKSKRQKHTVQNVTAFVIGANLAKQEDRHIDEKIRVLELKLLECER